MRCPTCSTTNLQSLRVGELELDECPECQGMWFDPGELQRLLEAKLTEASTSSPTGAGSEDDFLPKRGAQCLRCVGPLQARTESGLKLSACAWCNGMWVPASELRQLMGEPEPLPVEVVEEVDVVEVVAPAPVPPPLPKARPKEEAPSAEALQGGCTACGGSLRDKGTYHQCGRCGGAFFPRGVLPKLLASSRSRSELPVPAADGPEPGPEARCPACLHDMQPMRFQERSIRVWACSECWSTFASSSGLRTIASPNRDEEPAFEGSALFLWRVLDTFTEWLVNPSRSPRGRPR